MFRPSRLRSRRATALASACLGVAAGGALLVAPLPAFAANAGVRVVDNAYEPRAVEIRVGDSVTWAWAGSNPHSVTSPGNFDSHPECTSLTTGSCGTTGERFVYTATAPGTIEYRCRIHADMTGTIVVAAAPTPSATPSPAPSPTSTPAPPPPSPSPTATTAPPPSPRPSPTASPSPSPTPRPTPSPTPRPGPPTSPSPQPIPTITPTATPSATARPTPRRSFTPFPRPPESPAASEDPLDDDIVAVDIPGGGGPGETPVRIIGATIFGLSAVALGRFVLFAEPWDD